MKKQLFLSIMATIISVPLFGQNIYKVKILDKETNLPVIGALGSIDSLSLGAASDVNGYLEISNIPNGSYIVGYSVIGYQSKLESVLFPLPAADTALVFLEQSINQLEVVKISSTRSSRSVRDIPTRVEFISGEELDEKSNMKPGDLRVLLSESTGIQVQQTSATSANASIRIQGLDGRYTQLLKDGFPMYSGASSGLGLLQTPPLDLKRVEIIKGSSSTLYGGGAIAGMVNLISKTPDYEKEFSFHLDGTSAKGLNVSSFYSKRNKKIGTTLFTSYNKNVAYDPSGNGFSAIPQFDRLTFNPKFFYYPNKKTTVSIGINSSLEDRLGGNMKYIAGEGDSINNFFENNKTQRIGSQFELVHTIDSMSKFIMKNSLNYFNRTIDTKSFSFNGVQKASFSELNYVTEKGKLDWVVGLNLWTDQFDENPTTDLLDRSSAQNVAGTFVQNSWSTTKWLTVESGIRTDYVFDYGAVLLPKVSFLFKASKKLSSRLGGGFGYKAPTIFTEESERMQDQNIEPISSVDNKLERSYGLNWDVNYRMVLGESVLITINHLFFYTYLDNPLILKPSGLDSYKFHNINGRMNTKGSETNVKVSYDDFKLFLGYTYVDARMVDEGVESYAPLTPLHRTNSVLMYEVDEKWKIGLEGYYYSRQRLSDGSSGQDYFLMGFMAEKIWEKISVYVNFENFLDVRQTKFESVYSGSVTNPEFKEIYAPMDGFVMNGGVKVRL